MTHTLSQTDNYRQKYTVAVPGNFRRNSWKLGKSNGYVYKKMLFILLISIRYKEIVEIGEDEMVLQFYQQLITFYI